MTSKGGMTLALVAFGAVLVYLALQAKKASTQIQRTTAGINSAATSTLAQIAAGLASGISTAFRGTNRVAPPSTSMQPDHLTPSALQDARDTAALDRHDNAILDAQIKTDDWQPIFSDTNPGEDEFNLVMGDE